MPRLVGFSGIFLFHANRLSNLPQFSRCVPAYTSSVISPASVLFPARQISCQHSYEDHSQMAGMCKGFALLSLLQWTWNKMNMREKLPDGARKNYLNMIVRKQLPKSTSREDCLVEAIVGYIKDRKARNQHGYAMCNLHWYDVMYLPHVRRQQHGGEEKFNAKIGDIETLVYVTLKYDCHVFQLRNLKLHGFFLTFNVNQFILKLEVFFISQSMPAVRRAGNSQATGLLVLNFIYQFGGGTGFRAYVGVSGRSFHSNYLLILLQDDYLTFLDWTFQALAKSLGHDGLHRLGSWSAALSVCSLLW